MGVGFPFGPLTAAAVLCGLRLAAGVLCDHFTRRCGFRYDAAAREASWDTPGGRV